MRKLLLSCKPVARHATVFLFLAALWFFLPLPPMNAQTQNLTMVVLVDSTNTSGYNTNPATPGTYQMCPERYLVHLQIPYQVIDVSQTAAQNLNSVQLIVAGHAGLNLSAAWQAAIITAVAGGTGFVNLDSAVAIGQETHIRTIFGATGATIGQTQNTIVIPAAMQAGGATPHYIDALQMHWAGDSAGNLTYEYIGNGSSATILTGAKGSIVAELGTDPLILATTYGSGRAVDFTTYDYMHPTQFGFVQGVDDLFWRSLVWAARKPFVLRGYPHLTAVQMDDNDSGIMSRIPDLWNTTLTGTVASDGTGGPWTPELNMQLSSLASGEGSDRAPMIAAIKAGQMRASPHGLDYGSGGDLYWNLTKANTDAQWEANVTSTLQWQAGAGGADTFPPFSRAVVGHYWDISNNSGFETYNTFGTRYITAAFAPGTYYFNLPRTNAQRLPLEPFRIYEQPPEYSGDEEESYPYFYADNLTIGSVAGKPAQKFYTFGSQVLYANGRFSRNDNTFPSSTNSFTVAQSLNQWEYTMWYFWSGMMPVELYTHDDDNMNYSTTANRQSFITQLSQWCATNHCIHMFMDQMGDYMRARSNSQLSTASLSGTTLTLNFTGAATDFDGNLIDTKAWVFYGDTEGTLLDVPGFSNGATYTYSTTELPSIQLLPASLTFASTTGVSPASQTVTVGNQGSGTLTWSVTSSASWLTAAPTSGSQGSNVTVAVNSTSLATGTYTATLTFTAPGASNTPQNVPVTLTVGVAPSLSVSPTSLTFSGTVGAASPASQTVTITNPAGTNLGWTASSNATWLTFATGTAGTPGSLIVAATTGSLIVGTYTGAITLTPTSGSAPTVSVPVTFNVTAPAPTFTAAPTSLTFTATMGAVAAAQSVSLSSTPSSVTWTASSSATWLTATPTSGTATPASISIAASAATLSAGSYNGTVTVTPSSGSAAQIKVTFTVSAAPSLSVSPTALTFSGTVGAASPPTQTVTITNPAGTNLAWTASSNAAWLTFATGTAGTPGSLIVTSTTGSLLAGTYTGTITLTPTSGSAPAVSVPVNFNVAASTLTAAPTSLTFAANAGAVAAAQSVSLSSTPSSVAWTASSSATWLTVTPTSGTATPASISIAASAAALTAGSYSGTVTVTPSSGSAVQISVTFTVSASTTSTFTASPSSLTFSAAAAASTAAQTVSLASTPASVSWSASSNVTWLTLKATTGKKTPATFTATASAASLAVGTYTGTITITPSTGPVAQVSVSFNVTPSETAVVAVTPATMDFFAPVGSSPSPATLAVTNAGTGTMNWTAASNSTWLVPTPISALVPGTLTLTPSTASLPSGNQAASVTVASINAANQVVVPVTVHMGTAIFSDNFTSSAQWTASPLGLATNWSIVSNTFHYKGAAESVEYAGSQSWANYIVSTNFALTNVKDYPGGLRGRVNLTSGASYAAWIYPAENIIKLWRVAAWNIDTSGLTLLGTSPTLTMNTGTHNLTMAFSGSQINVYYDGVLVTSATDTTYTTGAIALDGSSEPISFSNVSVLQQ